MPTINSTILNGLPVEIDYSYSMGEIDINAIYFTPKGKERKTYFISEGMEERITVDGWKTLQEACYINEMESRYDYERELV